MLIWQTAVFLIVLFIGGCAIWRPDLINNHAVKKILHKIKNNSIRFYIVLACSITLIFILVDWIFGFDKGTKPMLDFLTSMGTVGATLFAAYGAYENFMLKRNEATFKLSETLCEEADQIYNKLVLNNVYEDNNLFMAIECLWVGSFLIGNSKFLYKETRSKVINMQEMNHVDSDAYSTEMDVLKNKTIIFIKKIQELKQYSTFTGIYHIHYFSEILNELLKYLLHPFKSEDDVIEMLRECFCKNDDSETIDEIRKIYNKEANIDNELLLKCIKIYYDFLDSLKLLENISSQAKMQYKKYINYAELFGMNKNQENITVLGSIIHTLITSSFSSLESKEFINKKYPCFIELCTISNLTIKSLKQEELVIYPIMGSDY